MKSTKRRSYVSHASTTHPPAHSQNRSRTHAEVVTLRCLLIKEIRPRPVGEEQVATRVGGRSAAVSEVQTRCLRDATHTIDQSMYYLKCSPWKWSRNTFGRSGRIHRLNCLPNGLVRVRPRGTSRNCRIQPRIIPYTL